MNVEDEYGADQVERNEEFKQATVLVNAAGSSSNRES